MGRRRRAVPPALLVLLLVFAAACTSASPTQGPASPAPASPAPASPAPSDTGTATAGPSSPDPGSGSLHADLDLEAVLPKSVGGFLLEKGSQRGTDLTDPGRQFTDMLSRLGRSLSDFTVASGYARELKAEVGVWRIAGADPNRLIPEFVQAVQDSSTTQLHVSEVTVAGRPVTQIGAEHELTKGPIYAFVKDGLLFFVESTEVALAEDALKKLP